MSEGLGTMLAALVAAVVAMTGYIYQKNQEREFSLTKMRRKIYRRVIENIGKTAMLAPIINQDPGIAALGDVNDRYALAGRKYPSFQELLANRFEIYSLLCVYGTDSAIKKASAVQKQFALIGQESMKPKPDYSQLEAPDIPGLVLTLRTSLYAESNELEKTTVSKLEIAQLLTP